MLALVRAYGMQPNVTLLHFTVPMWFWDADHFLLAENVGKFARFCSVVADELGDLIEYYATSNEINLQAMSMYVNQNHPHRDS